MSRIKIVEVGPRDGLQNEKIKLSVAIRVELIRKLREAGLRHIEVGAFVSPKWVPQMMGTDKVISRLDLKEKNCSYRALVPNSRGMTDALSSKIHEIAIFGACSETFSKKNINCTIDESLERFAEVIREAKRNRIKVRGYLSTVFGCPYEGKVALPKVVRLIEKLISLGVYEVSLGDTIGVATPKQVESLLRKVKDKPYFSKLAMHFHDTRGTALANVLMSLQYGVKSFDSSVGGLGGCPYAAGASGNLATEDLVYMLHGMGHTTGVDLERLIKVKVWIEKKVGHSLPSRVGQAGG